MTWLYVIAFLAVASVWLAILGLAGAIGWLVWRAWCWWAHAAQRATTCQRETDAPQPSGCPSLRLSTHEVSMISLTEHIAIETEGERSPPSDPFDAAVRTLLDLRDGGRFAQVKRLNAHTLRDLSPIERRLLLDWIVAQVAEFEQAAALLSRAIVVGEVHVPEYLRERAAL